MGNAVRVQNGSRSMVTGSHSPGLLRGRQQRPRRYSPAMQGVRAFLLAQLVYRHDVMQVMHPTL
jgi:hypothetical protein